MLDKNYIISLYYSHYWDLCPLSQPDTVSGYEKERAIIYNTSPVQIGRYHNQSSIFLVKELPSRCFPSSLSPSKLIQGQENYQIKSQTLIKTTLYFKQHNSFICPPLLHLICLININMKYNAFLIRVTVIYIVTVRTAPKSLGLRSIVLAV